MKKQYNHSFAGEIRIISGKWKGRQLFVSKSSFLRPTTGRMRKTLFDWLSQSIVNARCLDCFSGSGALGIEALSRHALSATLLEINYGIASRIQKNILLLKTARAKVINVNTLSFLARKGTPHDIVFVDPPFHKGLLQKTLNLLEKNGWLNSEALVFIENEKEKSPEIPMCWSLFREKEIGQSVCHLYYRRSY